MKNPNAGYFLKVIVLALLLSPVAGWAADVFERPAILEPDIAFWRRVFAETTTNQALLHDSRYLEVVYEVVEIPADASPTHRRRIADLSRDRYRDMLLKLAAGDRTGLNGEEQRVLALWPQDVTAAELREAAKRIRFQQGLSDRFRAGLKRSGAWKNYIEQQLLAADVPLGLAALPHVESSFNPEARSHVGAAGLWQFTRSTGQRFMEIDHVVDERRDPFRSSEAAADLLAYNYSILKSWPLAITAYNHGVAGMRRAVRTMNTEDMGVINREYVGRTFGFASRNFYVAFLAALEVQENAERYFGVVEMDKPRTDLLVKSPGYVSAATLAKTLGVTQETLKTYNPALLAPVWDGTKYVPRGFPLRIPAALVDMTEDEILEAIPADQRYASQTPDMYHKIVRGESLSVIAARYDTTVRDLMSLNGLQSSHRIRAGQTLRLPYSGVSVPEGAASYTVSSGDSLGKIASRAGVSEASLMAMNQLRDKNRIYVGQVLYLVPQEQEESAAPVATAVVAAVVTESAESGAVAAKETVAVAEEPAIEPVAITMAVVAEEDEQLANQVADDYVDEQAVALADVADDNLAEDPVIAVTESEADAAAMASLADPNDYSVADDNSIEIQAVETLGHYADWLQIKTQRLRDINGTSYSTPVVVGQRIKLDFSNVTADEFVAQRVAHHREIQEAFFVSYRVTDTTEHKLQQGESVWVLTQRRYKVPVWLLRQYNPDLDFGRVRPGMNIVFPRIEAVEQEAKIRQSVAELS